MRTTTLILSALGFSPTVLAMPLHPERGYGGALTGAGWSSPASIASNPAALPRDGSLRLLAEGNLLWDYRSVETHRYGGIDPNTQAPYPIAVSDQRTSGGFIGVIWPLPLERLVLGMSVSTPLQSHLDYRDDSDEVCLDTPTRYSVIAWESSSLLVTPALGVRIIEGLQLGGSLSLSMDRMYIRQAMDPLGSEGLGPGDDAPGFVVPYSNDVLLDASLKGTHLEWTGGIWIDSIPFVSLGASYTWRSSMSMSGSGELDFPKMIGGVTVDSRVEMDRPLASELRLGLATDPERRIRGSLSWSLERWGDCCGSREQDALLTVTAQDGDPIGPEQCVIIEVPTEFYQPRRLENSTYSRVGLAADVLPSVELAVHAARQTPAVQSYALHALQQDFLTTDLGLHTRVALGESLSVGLSYVRRTAESRLIDDSAWDVRSVTAEDLLEDYVDERFSPQQPYLASANGEYAHESHGLSLRLELQR
jgi:hypothetical protein